MLITDFISDSLQMVSFSWRMMNIQGMEMSKSGNHFSQKFELNKKVIKDNGSMRIINTLIAIVKPVAIRMLPITCTR